MNIPLKTLLIFCLVATTAAQSSTNEPSTSTASISTTDGTTVTTDVPSTSTASISTTDGTTAPVETSTGTFATDTTGDTSASTTIMTQASKETSTGTFNTDATDDTTTSTTPATTTTTTQGPCASSRCVGDSTCEERFGGSFACICRSGLVYLEMRGCSPAKVFPVSVSLDRMFNENMADRTTKEFFETASEIEEALRNTLGEDDSSYTNSTVLSLRLGSIIADVQNFYDLSSSATSESVGMKIKDAIGSIPDASISKQGSVCDTDICDSTTTTCQELVEGSGTASCICKEGYIRSQFTTFSCHPCPNGEMADGGNCKKCPFGYAGFNCNDPYLLVVVVVSTVLGALLIIFIVALIVVSCRNEKEISSSQVDFSSSYGNKELHKPTGVPRIPRANPDASWKSNTLEMTDSGSNQALVTRDRPESKARYTDYDDDMSYRGQIPPAYGGRGVENGGAHNPYFRQDDDRMHRY